MSELDAPATEFAAPHDSVAGHQHQPGHVPTPDGTYTVEPNDSFWTISQKVYGTGGYFKAVQRHNRKPGDPADGLEIGEKILVPPAEVLEQKYPQLCPKRRAGPGGSGRMVPASSQGGARGGRVYVVEQGDTLFDIARFELGKASRWAEIYDLNRHQLGNDYNYVAPGTKLILPDDAASNSDTLTTRRAGRTRDRRVAAGGRQWPEGSGQYSRVPIGHQCRWRWAAGRCSIPARRELATRLAGRCNE